MPRRYDHRLASRRAPVESTPAGCTTPPCGAPRISCIPCIPRAPSVPRARPSPRSVVLRLEIGPVLRRDRSQSALRSVHFHLEIGPVLRRDCGVRTSGTLGCGGPRCGGSRGWGAYGLGSIAVSQLY